MNGRPRARKSSEPRSRRAASQARDNDDGASRGLTALHRGEGLAFCGLREPLVRMTEPSGIRRVLRRADEHRQLPGLGSGEPAGGRHRSRARLRSGRWDRRYAFRAARARCRGGAGAGHHACAGDPRSCRPFVGGAAIQGQDGAKIGIGEQIREVQEVFRPMFCADDLKVDGGDFDLLLSDGDRIPLGELEVEVIETPGHTAAGVSYRSATQPSWAIPCSCPTMGPPEPISPAATRGSSIGRSSGFSRFRPRRGCSCVTITRLPGRNDYRWETTVAEKRRNVHIAAWRDRGGVRSHARARDATLSRPSCSAVDPGEHRGRPAAASGREWRFLLGFRCGSRPVRSLD